MFEMYSKRWALDEIDTYQRNYGVAVSDVDNDGDFEFIVAGFSGPNLILKFNKKVGKLENIATKNSPYANLRDEKGAAIGVCACDIDGDGKEEIYFLNVNQAYAGKSAYGDKLYKWRNGRYVDLYSDKVNRNLTVKDFAGRSVACIDRKGNGKYGVAVATYSSQGTGKFALVEMNDAHKENDVGNGKIVLQNVAKAAGIERSTGGRGVTVGPIVSDNGRSDIFFDNEGSGWFHNEADNYLFKNNGSGIFKDVARSWNILDNEQHGRGVALGDFDQNGLLDIVVGNWLGPHRFFLQVTEKNNQKRVFKNVATGEFEKPTPIRTMIAQDFDNNGHLDVLHNNIKMDSSPQPNKLFEVVSKGHGMVPQIKDLDIGDALEPHGFGTGGSVADIDGDGMLELLLSHGEGAAQPLEIYHVARGMENKWLRIYPVTIYGAPARGALVTIYTNTGDRQMRVIDGGSGYLCQMEPVAHFGLGQNIANQVEVVWPDGRVIKRALAASEMNTFHLIEHPDRHVGGGDTVDNATKMVVNVTTPDHNEL